MLDRAQTLINEMRLGGKEAEARKCLVVYQESCAKAKKIGEDYENLCKRYIAKQAEARVGESMKKGKIFKVEGVDEDDDEFNQSIKDIQMDNQLTQEQRRLKVEAEVPIRHNTF